MIEYKSSGNPEMLAQIFNSVGKEGTSSVQVTNATRSPRVQQAQSAYDTQQVQQQYQQQYEQQQAMTQAQQQAMTQAQQQPVNPQAPYPQATR
jgi:preprotein translocase subunit SecF